MTQEQFDVRLKRAAEELFVISTTNTNDGWRVRSAHKPFAALPGFWRRRRLAMQLSGF
jgi:hypothetical protein